MPGSERGVGYYDRLGKEIDMERYGRLMQETPDYKIVKQTERYGILVSTVWLGMNHAFRPMSPILIFETMIFSDGSSQVFDYQERYTTEAQALEGHRRACQLVFLVAVSDGSGKWREAI